MRRSGEMGSTGKGNPGDGNSQCKGTESTFFEVESFPQSELFSSSWDASWLHKDRGM